MDLKDNDVDIEIKEFIASQVKSILIDIVMSAVMVIYILVSIKSLMKG